VVTPTVTAAYNGLRQDIVVLLDLQTILQQKEYEYYCLSAQKEKLTKALQDQEKAQVRQALCDLWLFVNCIVM
jgi:hypothetical protein